jgi:hypothetical protein
MISLASSFQRHQPRYVSITLAPTNPRRTLHLLKFRRTSGELFRWNRALPVQMDTTMEFPSSSSTPWCARSRESGVDCVVFPNSGDSSATPASSSVAIVHFGRRWAHHRVRLVIFFPFCRLIYSFVVIPVESSLHSLSLSILFRVDLHGPRFVFTRCLWPSLPFPHACSHVCP